VPEKRSDNIVERRQSNSTFVKDLLDGVFDIQLEDDGTEKMFRLGCWAESKACPLLVSFKDVAHSAHKETVLSNQAKLKAPTEKFRGMGNWEFPLTSTPRTGKRSNGRWAKQNRHTLQRNPMKWKTTGSLW